MEKTPARVLLSGGIDSSTLLYSLVADGRPTVAVFVDYGQPALEPELDAASTIAARAGVRLESTTVPGLPRLPSGVVHNRNAIMALVVASRAPQPVLIGLAIHSGTPYADCSPPFAQAIQDLLDLEHNGSVRLLTPFLHWTKGEIVALGRDLGVPFDHCFSCEQPTPAPCGSCSSCLDREAIGC